MTIDLYLGVAAGLALLVYFIVALLAPERF